MKWNSKIPTNGGWLMFLCLLGLAHDWEITLSNETEIKINSTSSFLKCQLHEMTLSNSDFFFLFSWVTKWDASFWITLVEVASFPAAPVTPSWPTGLNSSRRASPEPPAERFCLTRWLDSPSFTVELPQTSILIVD